MSEIKYLYACNEFTICSGIDNVEKGIEISLKELFLNANALKILGFIPRMCDLSKPEKTFGWYCSYLAQFVMTESKQREEYYLTNPKIQILCSGELLIKLKNCFKL